MAIYALLAHILIYGFIFFITDAIQGMQEFAETDVGVGLKLPASLNQFLNLIID